MFNNRIQTSMFFVLAAVVALNVTIGSPPALAQFEFAKILASDGLEGDGFGYSVALSGDTAVIGAWFNDNHAGSAYVYRYDGLSWVQEAKLQASDRAPWDLFGWSVDISGEALVVGAIRDADAGTFTGSAYIFRFDGSKWVEEQKLLASDYAYWDEFGFSVAISGDIAVIGAIRNDDNDPNSGSAYIFRFDGSNWVEEQKLLASDGATEDHFGNSVAISGNTAVVGAYLHDSPSNSGAAYVFRFDGSKWVEEQKLLALDTTYADHLGSSVAISGETIVVGAYGDDNADPDNIYCNSGSAYVFRFNGSSWVEEAKLQVPDSECGNQFGWALDISPATARAFAETSGDTVVVGGPDGHWGSTSGPGFAYVFDFDGSNWIRRAKLTGSDTAYGDHFGWSVGVSGGMALVGADWDDDNGLDSGSAYVFYVAVHPGDFDTDGDVDLEDFAIFASAWLTESGKTGWNPDCDINVPADKSVGMLDLIVFAEHWLAAVE